MGRASATIERGRFIGYHVTVANRAGAMVERVFFWTIASARTFAQEYANAQQFVEEWNEDLQD